MSRQLVDSFDVDPTVANTTVEVNQNSTTECNPIDVSNLKTQFQTKMKEYEDQKRMCAYVIERLQDERARSTIDIERDSRCSVRQTDLGHGNGELASIFRQLDNVTPGLNVHTAIMDTLISALDNATLGFNHLRCDCTQVMRSLNDEGKRLETDLDLKSIFNSGHEEMFQVFNKVLNSSYTKEEISSITNTLSDIFGAIDKELTDLGTNVNSSSLQERIEEMKGEIVDLNRTLFTNLSAGRISNARGLSEELSHFKELQGNLSIKFKDKINQVISNIFSNDSIPTINQKKDNQTHWFQKAIQSINDSYQEYLRAKVVTISGKLNFLFSDKIKNYECATAHEKLSNATQNVNNNVEFVRSLIEKQESRIVSRLERNMRQMSQQNAEALAVLTRAVSDIERNTRELLQSNNDSLNALTRKISQIENDVSQTLQNNANNLNDVRRMVENQLKRSKTNRETLAFVSKYVNVTTGKYIQAICNSFILMEKKTSLKNMFSQVYMAFVLRYAYCFEKNI